MKSLRDVAPDLGTGEWVTNNFFFLDFYIFVFQPSLQVSLQRAEEEP